MTLVLIFRKISELHGKRYPISNLNMHLAQFPQIVGITKEGSVPLFGKCSAKKVINILEQFQWLNTTYYRVSLDLIRNCMRLKTKKIWYIQIYLMKYEIYLRRVDYPRFWPFLDYPTLYPRSMPITLKWGILPYCGSPAAKALPWPSVQKVSGAHPGYCIRDLSLAFSSCKWCSGNTAL